jgi:hypothetical protein
MLLLQVFDLAERLIFKVGEVLLPLVIEVLQLSVTNFDVLRKLSLLDVLSEFVLVLHDILFKLTHLTHKVFEHLIFQDVTELLCQQLHLGLDQ